MILTRLPILALWAGLGLAALGQGPPSNRSARTPTDQSLYEAFFFRVNWLEAKGAKAASQGKTSSLPSVIQSQAGLTAQEAASLKLIARDWKATNEPIVAQLKALAPNGGMPPDSPRTRALVKQRIENVLNHKTKLQTVFGPARFAALDHYVRQTVVPMGGGPSPRVAVNGK
jgi:hypothetical protein